MPLEAIYPVRVEIIFKFISLKSMMMLMMMMVMTIIIIFYYNHNYIKILESDWSSADLISAVIVQLHTSCACNWTVVRVMPE